MLNSHKRDKLCIVLHSTNAATLHVTHTDTMTILGGHDTHIGENEIRALSECCVPSC